MEDEADLELGLGLCIKASKPCNKGSKRPAESANIDGNSSGQLVGWPPIRAFRINSLVKPSRAEDDRKDDDSKRKTKVEDDSVDKPANRGFVKVNMDGIPIGRKVDLASLCSYDALASILENMFLLNHSLYSSSEANGEKASYLLNGLMGSVLTYQDKEGDWMLVGDVPWGMFINSVKRLRIMRTSEAKGLAPSKKFM